MDTANKTRVILFWSLMVFLALAFAGINAMNRWRSARLADFAPLMLVVLLFVVVYSADRALKRRVK